MTKTLATQRTLKLLRDEGWICAVVEKWLPPRGEMKFGIRIDVWNFGDIIACRPMDKEIALVQCFPDSGGKAGFDAHRVKTFAIPEAKIWLRCGGKIFLYGWKPKLKSDTAPGNWRWKREEIVLES